MKTPKLIIIFFMTAFYASVWAQTQNAFYQPSIRPTNDKMIWGVNGHSLVQEAYGFGELNYDKTKIDAILQKQIDNLKLFNFKYYRTGTIIKDYKTYYMSNCPMPESTLKDFFIKLQSEGIEVLASVDVDADEVFTNTETINYLNGLSHGQFVAKKYGSLINYYPKVASVNKFSNTIS